ncbi:5'-methylthioadenosine/S-adenosylhomocysteine nucleosidase [Haloechinothrix sp. LS1_15]|uniref:5'-methylthioadenosine/S-adenosylhomocysteine nucleosidase family protein n=1 Tax=Haloechinothrix sp. LS1_15 TaxID=2652248 RepID=UPI0029460DFB|nr:5'-methylthioadenosine/S-adenosylhomocysteine nucleosidase [Haloechinothrix sp. LS1_15]MDV6011973.1 5'-methylthioadenosine/S-adenosylhomocysteine nucleosidase [Haloechinothrix sp. LS1_15]
MTQRPVVILTALNLEYDAVRQHLTHPRVHRHERGTRFEVGMLRDTECRVALGITGKGNEPAAVLVERAIQRFSPTAVLFAGVAGALWDATPLGDVVLATQVYAYHGGTSEDDGLKARPRSWEVPHAISQLAHDLARKADWISHIANGSAVPHIHFGPIAAGDIVQNSRISHEARWIRQHYNDALAIEMESAGVAQAGHLNGTQVAIVRGISDRADGTKSSDEDRAWQPTAAANAAAFAVRLAEEMIKERDVSAMHEGNDMTDRNTTIHNVASGQVGIQAAHVTGSTVRMESPTPSSTAADLVSELRDLREQLKRERSTGMLDDDTYEAAEAELDIASEALESNTPDGRNRFVVAMKRLGGLVTDVAALATKVATLIAVARGLT